MKTLLIILAHLMSRYHIFQGVMFTGLTASMLYVAVQDIVYLTTWVNYLQVGQMPKLMLALGAGSTVACALHSCRTGVTLRCATLCSRRPLGAGRQQGAALRNVILLCTSATESCSRSKMCTGLVTQANLMQASQKISLLPYVPAPQHPAACSS